MKRYLKNLLMALTGRNPFRYELDELKDKYEKAEENVKNITDLYYYMCEKMDGAEQRFGDYQSLIENLRSRVTDKDKLIYELEKELSKR